MGKFDCAESGEKRGPEKLEVGVRGWGGPLLRGAEVTVIQRHDRVGDRTQEWGARHIGAADAGVAS